MNILLLNWRDPKNPKAGGAEVVSLEHAKAWVKVGHRVWWFSPKYPNALPEEIVEGVSIIRRGTTLTMHIYAILYYLFGGVTFDVVVDEIHGLPFFTPLYVKKPKIVFIHEVANEIWDYMYPFPIAAAGKLFEKIMLFPYRRIPFLTISNSTKEELIKSGIASSHITITTPGFHARPLTSPAKKEKDITCIFVSRVVKMKGVEEVIKAFAFIHKEEVTAKLWIVGRGEEGYIKKLHSMAKEYHIEKSIKFLGGVPEKEKLSLMSKAHVLLHASIKEGWGLVVIEAASQGSPAVVYNVPGLRDSVHNGQTGIVIKDNSPLEMARSVLSLYKDKQLYIKLQKTAMGWAKSLTWEKGTTVSTQLLERIAKK